MKFVRSSYGISVRMFLSLGVLVLLAVLVSMIAINAYNGFQQRFNDVAVDGVKAIIAASDLRQFNASLMSFAPSMMTARSQQANESVMFQVRDQDALLGNAIAQLSNNAVDSQQAERLNGYRSKLSDSFHELSRLVSKRLEWEDNWRRTLSNINQLQSDFTQEHHTVAAESGAALHSNWYLTFANMTILLNQLNGVEHPVLLRRYQKEFGVLERKLESEMVLFDEGERLKHQQALTKIVELARGQNGLFALNQTKFQVQSELDGVFFQHRQSVSRFLSVTTVIIDQIERKVMRQNQDIVEQTKQRTIQLVLAAIICVVAGVGIFLYIDRSVISRIQTLKTSMEAHAKGTLVRIPLEGHDEITDMAGTLKFFVDTIQDREHQLKQARNAASRAQNQLLDAIESITEGFVLYDEKDKLVLCNARYRELYGFPDAWDMEGRDFSDLLLWLSRRNKVIQPENYLEKRLALRDNRIQNLDLELSNGTWISIIERRTEQGGTVGVHTDITHRKVAENALICAMEKAESADRAKSQFLASASHDLRQPLHAMGLLLEPLLEDARHTPYYERLEDVYFAHQSMNQLFTDILDFSRLEAGAITPRLEHFALDCMLTRLAQEYRHSLDKPESALRYVPTSALVFADLAMVERIVRNLLSNAVRYSDHGKILLGVRNRKEQICIQVWDNGPGIPLHEQQKIFKEFYQGKKTQTAGKSGLGLGLAITMQLVKLMDGDIHVHSSECGTGFSIALPRGKRDALNTQPDQERYPTRKMDGLPILLVENDPQVMNTTRQLLERWGCKVHEFQHYADVECYAYSNPDPFILISDFHLDDGYTALDVIAELNNKSNRPEFTSVVISGDSSPEVRMDAESIGAHFLTKPVRAGKLGALLRHIWRELNN
ncbi:response regulator [Vibrio sp. S9_S30]|uniref:hybrid sensor histidine kinase/response regulator n=1 Tax=Vibrio sp. S9_S30 TaxID=2720226 RepID=UPI001681C0C2|nr:ATP-binding protein [Vibrio sp. S9_S30]MBD1556258.1 response regulator [Vibrio sp. S9_S30]